MKITEVRTRVVQWEGKTVPLPPHFCTNPMDLLAQDLIRGAEASMSTFTFHGWLVVEVFTDSGHVGIGNAGPDPTSARLLLDLPNGLTATSPNPIGCPVGQGTLDCGRQDLAAGEEGDQFSRLRADRPGSYTVVVRATELTTSDPNPANNTASLTISVQAPKPTVRGFAISPAKPRAGTPLRVSYAITEQVTGQALVPSAVRCSATARAAKVAGRGSARGARATCTFLPRSSARGKTMHGRVTATVAGTEVEKAFAVRLR